MAGFCGAQRQRDLVCDFQAVALEGDHFAWMICEDADAAQSEIDQYLRADAAFALDQTLAAQIVIELFALMKTDAREFGAVRFTRIDLKSPPGVMQINEDAAVCLRDGCERAVNHGAAIAGG